jgi:hypothetical protein
MRSLAALWLSLLCCLPSPKPVPMLPPVVEAPSVKVAGQKLLVTAKTEILLDGAPAKLEDVPASAELVVIESSADGKEALKLYFRSKP